MNEYLNEALGGLPDRLRDALGQVEGAISEAEAHLQELRQDRGQIQRVLKTIEPETSKTNTKKVRSKTTGQVSDERLRELEDWLRAHIKDKPFYSTAIAGRGDFNVLSGQSTLSRALRVLHERGVIRLDGVTGSGGRKTYRLTKP